jgi:succinate dehydrogenase / fumarate reductase cytochrome b subunit
VTTATAPDYSVHRIAGNQHFLLRRLHSLTGIVFGGYLIIHLVVNATLAQRGEVYQNQVNKIHALPWLAVIEWTFIYLPILYHTVYGIWIFASGQPNVISYPYGKNWFYLFQRLSAIYIALFLAFHVLSLKYGAFGNDLGFNPHDATRTIARHMHYNASLTLIVYPLGVLASAYHTANGFWTAAITWGLTISAAAQKRWGGVCAGLFGLLFIAGMVALVAAGTQSVQ